MAFAASGDNIRSITGTTKDDSALSPFINAANLKVKRVFNCNPDLLDSELSAVADWYASYLLVAGGSDTSLNVRRRKLEQFEIEYQGGISGDNATQRYFDTANDLSGGCLATLDKQKAQITGVG